MIVSVSLKFLFRNERLARVSTPPYAFGSSFNATICIKRCSARAESQSTAQAMRNPESVSPIRPGVWGNHSKVWTMRTLPEAEPVLPRASTSALRIASHRSLNARSAAAARVHSCRLRGFQGQLSRWLRPKARARSTHRSFVEGTVPQRRSHKF